MCGPTLRGGPSGWLVLLEHLVPADVDEATPDPVGQDHEYHRTPRCRRQPIGRRAGQEPTEFAKLTSFFGEYLNQPPGRRLGSLTPSTR
ncbi:hypothetical protein [Streptomyces sp. NBC_00258]|uniref:hypothetical protein n=1 Tax=Streptomyces sp. NBC_00258 TaxID=2903642 RepID=UPI00117EBCE6|nr:hypothetical protein [Streptomyces sp. NBC_00258]TRO58275.1 hypothetical protein E4K73_38880 [Streptomyces sp. IB201691-2A2]